MVIRLTTGAQIGGAIRYNEQKVAQKQALALDAQGFANNELALVNKQYTTQVLEAQGHKNGRVTKPTLHFSLSLHPTEQVSDEKFKAMAHEFMAQMGYQKQPYIVYRHHDTAHPHIHIVTTCVDETGGKINDAFIKRRTNTVREKLELRFGLVKAQGRGKENEPQQAVELAPAAPSQAVEKGEFQKREQLEAILRHTFQQAVFSTIDEYKALLKQQQIHTTLHQSTVGGKVLRGISYQFTDESGKATTPRIKASDIGTWATWKGVEKQFGKAQQEQVQQAPQAGKATPQPVIEPTNSQVEKANAQPPVEKINQPQPTEKAAQTHEQEQPNRLSDEQYKVLAAFLSDDLRSHKKEQHIYYDSALIENFPTAAMQERLLRLTQNRITDEQANEAVRRFEEYKRSQLPEIIKKEQYAFARTMETYTKIASEIEGSALNKRQYYKALSVDLDNQGLLTSPTNRHLAYQIDPGRWDVIQSETGPNLKIPNLYSRGERTVLLLSESKKAFKESYYDVRAEHLARILQPGRMAAIHKQLNANFVDRLTQDGPVVGIEQIRYFYQRGIVIDRVPTPAPSAGTPVDAQAASGYTIRFNGAPPEAAVAPGLIFGKQIPHLNLESWQQGQTTEAGRYMVALAHCIDQAKEDKSKSKEVTFLRERIHKRDPALTKFSDEELVTVLEKRSLQGKGWIKQTEHEARQEPNAYLNESAMQAGLLNIRAADVLGYEQTGKYKHVGRGLKKRSKGQGREM